MSSFEKDVTWNTGYTMFTSTFRRGRGHEAFSRSPSAALADQASSAPIVPTFSRGIVERDGPTSTSLGAMSGNSGQPTAFSNRESVGPPEIVSSVLAFIGTPAWPTLEADRKSTS